MKSYVMVNVYDRKFMILKERNIWKRGTMVNGLYLQNCVINFLQRRTVREVLFSIAKKGRDYEDSITATMTRHLKADFTC